MFYLDYLNQMFVKFNLQGQFWNPQDKQIWELSLVLIIDQNLKELLNKTQYQFIAGVKEYLTKSKISNSFCRYCIYARRAKNKFKKDKALHKSSQIKILRNVFCETFDPLSNNTKDTTEDGLDSRELLLTKNFTSF